MSRVLLITLLNFSLPFLVWIAWLLWHHRRYKTQNPSMIDVTPRWHFPIVKLLAIGVALLALTLVTLRLWQTEPATDWHAASPAVSKEY